ncbi:hypothetical protein NLJ89_g7261 [Agrocybe chaxingu]|uniref:BAG domain-containing protein n=1 Tax=Agrocybe chaxingu TaxID=84603 RepID=A0A9W8JXP4_9AGAR|nr:hypothetical protein NLJ89_g7261 [Agrocybe chaxingu]
MSGLVQSDAHAEHGGSLTKKTATRTSEYSQLGPRQRAYLEAMRRQEAMGRLRAEEEARRERLFEEQRRQQELSRKQMEEEQEARQRLLEERRKPFQQKREEEARRLSEAFENEMVRETLGLYGVETDDLELQQSRLRQKQARSFSQAPPTQDNFRGSSTSRQPSKSPQSQTSNLPPTSPTSSRAPSPKQIYGEEHEEAASRIQRQFRIHQSYRTLHALSSQFEELRRNFVYPSSIDFQKPGEENAHITVAVAHVPADFEVPEDDTTDAEAPMDVDSNSSSQAKLAFTSTNYPIHQYVDQMDRILMNLDSVESWGEKGVRAGRKKVVKEIEKESAKLERYWKQAWSDHIEETEAKERQEEHMEAKKDVVDVEMATPALEDSLPPLVNTTATSPTEAKPESESTPAPPLGPPANLTLPTNTDSSSSTISEQPQTHDEERRGLQGKDEESEAEDVVTIPADIDEEAWDLDEATSNQTQAEPQVTCSKEDSDMQTAGDDWVDVGKTEL